MLLVVLVLAPVGAAFWSWARRDRSPEAPPVTAAGAAVALTAAVTLGLVVAQGGRPRLGAPDLAWLRADPLAVVMAVLVATLGTTILSYASRNLEGDRHAWRFSVLANLVLAATLLASVAGRLSVLVAAWVLTSLLLLGLIAYRRDGLSRAAARRAGLALGLGDAALVGALALVLVAHGDADLTSMGGVAGDLGARQLALPGPADVSFVAVAALLLVVAAAARASQLPLPLWLPGTLAAPTPVSALLHAGVVNAGGFLLIRLSPVLSASPAAHLVLAGVALTTILVTSGAAWLRADAKGALATSTSAQMGFMLLAVAVGAPLAALTHLIGHALYKASRFLGAGAAIGSARTARRHAVAPSLPQGRRALLSILVPGVVLLAVVGVAQPSVFHDGEAWVIGFAVGAVGVTATWARLGRGPVGVATVGGLALGLAVVLVGYLGLLAALDHVLGAGLVVDESNTVGAGWALGSLALATAAGAAALGRARTAPWLVSRLAAVGHPRPSSPPTALGRRRAPRVGRLPVLEAA